MTRRIAIVVEGQTEEAFVNRVLQPHLGFDTAYLCPIVVHTSHDGYGRAHRGGGTWTHYEGLLRKLLAQPHWSVITTLIDFYGLPEHTPACTCDGSHITASCATSREAAIHESLGGDPRFKPHIVAHEFETLIFAAAAESDEFLGDAGAAAQLRRMVDDHDGNAELINGGNRTAPSKRLLKLLPSYDKVRDSVTVLEDRLDTALQHAPRFAQWTASLTN